jgi:two-component system response regulator FixJ
MEVTLPVIVLTAHADIPMAVQTLKAGAVDFLEKPVHRQTLLERIQKALDQDAHSRYQRKRRGDVKAGLAQLSKREREVLDLLVAAHTTKEIAATLDIGLQTVAKHRAAILEKMGVCNVVELVRLISAVL